MQSSTHAAIQPLPLAAAQGQLAPLHLAEWTQRLDLSLEATAHQTKALQRRRKVKSASDLLRLILVYAVCDWSFRLVGAWCYLVGVGYLSDVAIRQRVRQSRTWLGLLIGQVLQQRRQQWTARPGVRLRLQDATSLSQPGSAGTDWRVHLSFDLSQLALDGIDLTDGHGAETLARFPTRPDEIILADRGYAFASSLGTVLRAGSQVLTRIRWRNPPLVSCRSPQWKLLTWLRGLAAVGEERVELKTPHGVFPLRLIAQPLPPQAAEQARRRLRRNASKKGHTLCEESLYCAGFVLLVTNLPAAEWSAVQLFELYRLRWQIELAIKRLKSLLHLDHLRAQDPQVVQSYLLAKLLAALMMEAEQHQIGQTCPEWFTSEQRPVSVWRVTQLSLEPVRQSLVGSFSLCQVLQSLPKLRRYMCDAPRRRRHQLAAARSLCARLFTG